MAMEITQRKVIRTILKAHDNVAIEALYGELGWLPIRYQVYTRVLSYYGRLCRLGETRPEGWTYKVAYITVLGEMNGGVHHSNPWARNVVSIASKLDLNLAEAQNVSKVVWGKRVKESVRKAFIKEWKAGVMVKTSLRFYLAKPEPKAETYVDGSAFAQLIFAARSGSLRVNQLLSKWFATSQVRPECPRCSAPSETIEHVLIHCPALFSSRQKLLSAVPFLNEIITISDVEKAQVFLGFREDPKIPWKALGSFLKDIMEGRTEDGWIENLVNVGHRTAAFLHNKDHPEGERDYALAPAEQ